MEEKNSNIICESITDEKKTKWQDMKFSEKFKFFRSNITVEPMLALCILPNILSALATQNLNLDKACRVNLNYGSHVCDALMRRDTANYTKEEQEVQQLLSGMLVWKGFLQHGLPCVLILFWGSWSDRHSRRKPCIIIPVIGHFLTVIGLIFCTYFDRIPLEATIVVESVFVAITGGWLVFAIGLFSYIADISTEEDRTFRIGILSIFFTLVAQIGTALQILLKFIGFYGIFSLSAVLNLCGILYGMFSIKEVQRDNLDKDKLNKKNILADFFDKKHVAETFRVAFKDGENQRRLRVILSMVVMIVISGPLHSEREIAYLFTRFKFNWSEVEYSLFTTFNMMTHVIGNIILMIIFLRLLKINDALIGAIACISKILSAFVEAFAQTQWQFFLGPVVAMLSGGSFIAIRSISSKIVHNSELGKLNSIIFMAEILTTMIYSPMYAKLYSVTLNTLPGAFYLLGGMIMVPAVFIFLWMYRFSKKNMKRNELEGKSLEIVIEGDRDLKSKSDEHNNNKNGQILLDSSSKSILHLSQRKGSQRHVKNSNEDGITNVAFDESNEQKI